MLEERNREGYRASPGCSLDAPAMGFELEVEPRDTSLDEDSNGCTGEFNFYQNAKEAGVFHNATSDCSLSYDGTEYRSFVHNLDTWRARLPLIHDGLRSLYQCQEGRRSVCGLHVHVSKCHLTTLGAYRLRLFAMTNPHGMLWISGRSRRAIERWASPHDTYPSVGRHSRPHSKVDMVGRPKDDVGLHCSGLRMHDRTFELRYFNSSNNTRIIMRALEFVDAMCHFTRRARVRELAWGRFVQHIATHQWRWPVAHEFCASEYQRDRYRRILQRPYVATRDLVANRLCFMDLEAASV